MPDYATITLDRRDQVATIAMLPTGQEARGGRPGGLHREMAEVFEELRQDDSVRVIVLTGTGDVFKAPGGTEVYANPSSPGTTEPTHAWRTFSGIVRCYNAMVEIEKPIVARVNGPAIGFGQSLVFASDLIVAREDAIFMDHHMGGVLNITEGGVQHQIGHEFSSVPGDGGAVFVPLSMTPCKTKEYLMLARPYTARELAATGAINYAVPVAELDAKVDELVQGLLRRGAYALAWTKRIVNRRVVDQMNRTLDAGVGYEMVSFLQREKLGGQQKMTLD